MTLNEYLATLTEEQRIAFAARVNAVGSQTVDAYSASKPNWYDEERNSFDVDSIHALYRHEGPGASSHYHILMLDYQYAYWSDPALRPVQGWLVAASKANKNWFKDMTKSDGTTEDGPRHVFGSSVYDPDEKVLIFPGTQKKQPIEVGPIAGAKKDDNQRN